MENSDEPWKVCLLCGEDKKFQLPEEFVSHLRQRHCRQEGGSFVCHYGYNSVCSSLPLEGVSDGDYRDHVMKHHVWPRGAVRKGSAGVGASVAVMSAAGAARGSDSLRWGVHSAAQNLPALLNDPARGRQRDLFTKTWGEGFVDREVLPAAHLPDIGHEDFQEYLRQTAKRFKKHLRKSASFKKESQSLDITKLSRLTEPEEDTGIGIVPRVFFDPSFELSRPDTFPVICPAAVPRRKTSDDMAHHNSGTQLQEKLTHYLDIVEVQIARQIADKSEAFFDAMSSHDSLMDQLSEAARSVKALRERMKFTLEQEVTSALRVLRRRQRRQNAGRLLRKLRLMATVHQTQPTIQLLLTTAEFVGALDLIATSQEVLSQELAGIQAFRHLSSQLTEMQRVIDKMVTADFVRHVTSDLNRPLDQPAADQEQLVSIMLGMIRLKNLNMVELYKDEACTTVRAVVKQTVIEALSALDIAEVAVGGDTSAADGAPLNQQVAQLPPGVWLRLLRQLCDNLTALLTRVKAVSDVMTEVLDAAMGRAQPALTNGTRAPHEPASTRLSITEEVEGAMLTSEEHGRVSAALTALLPAVADHAHERCGKLLQARMREGTVESGEFLSLAAQVREFVTDCERLCGRRSNALHLALQGQASQFVQRFHTERRSKLSLLLESERWRQADVPAEFQTIADHVSRSGEAGLPARLSCPESPERRPAPVLRLGEQKFAVVGTVLLLLRMLLEYCDCARHLPAVSADLLSKLVELLRFFNSRCCQLVVGAGAIQLLGLKTITSRNLALAARGLQLLTHHLPLIRRHFQALLPERSRPQLKHLDQVEADYGAHLAEIDAKLLVIIGGACETQLAKWEARPPVPSQQFRAVCRALTKLHEAVSGVLSPDHCHRLFGRMNEAFVESLRRRVARLAVKKDGGPQHGLVTSELVFYQEHLKTLDYRPEQPISDQLWSDD